MHIICCVPAQIPYLGKLLFLRYRPKCSQPIRLQDFLINCIPRSNQWNSLTFCMLIQISHKLKVDQKIFWVGVVRNGCDQFVHGTQSQKLIDGTNLFFACWCKFGKAKSCFTDFWVGLVKNGHGHLVHETLKSTEWVYQLSWFLYADCDANVSLLQFYLLNIQQ